MPNNIFNFSKLLLISCFSVALLAGCARALPLVSHAHIGHSLTAWRDTPGQKGLFVIAEEETSNALNEAKSAGFEKRSANRRARHVSNVIHALNPDVRNTGNGTGYGAIRALHGAIDHMRFAAESDDASANLIQMTARFSEGAVYVTDRLKQASRIALLAEKATHTESDALLTQLESVLSQVIDGKDINGDGVIGNHLNEYGLVQLRADISRSLYNETPSYQPLGKMYLLGLVRLPNGNWAYRFDLSDKNASSLDYSDDY